MTRNGIRAVVGILVVATALTASACHRHHTPSERADWMTGKVAKHLDLDDQQKAKLAAVKDKILAARADSQNEHRVLMDELLAQIQSERLDQAKAAQLIEQHHQLASRTMIRALPEVAEWHASLRSDQKAKAVEYIRRWAERYRDNP